MTTWPTASYLLLASRLYPRVDGGFKVAVLARARHMAETGAGDGRGPTILTVDPGTPEEHAAHRASFVARGLAASAEVFRNLFDEAHADSAWAWDAATPGGATPGVVYRDIPLGDGTVLSLPVIAAPDWHLTDAAVVVRRPSGTRVLPGFGGLYCAWLDRVVAAERAASPDRPVVVVCESRQLGELLAGWRPPGVCLVHTVHTSHRGADGEHAQLWRRWFALVDAFDAVLWPTRQQYDDVVAEHGENPVHAVVPNALPVPAPAVVEAQPGRVVAVGRLAPGKRFDHALRVWYRVLRAVPHARLDVYGEGPSRAELEQMIFAHGLAGSVTLFGHVDDLDVCRNGAVVVQTSAFEGQGLAVLEAMACGNPVVSYDVPYGPRELLGDGAGILVPDGDLDALADALITVLGDPALRARLSARAVARAADYAPETVMARLAAVVAGALGRAAARDGAQPSGTAVPSTSAYSRRSQAPNPGSSSVSEGSGLATTGS
ncbi:glycosyltransferase [Microbacterium sp. GXF7504]